SLTRRPPRQKNRLKNVSADGTGGDKAEQESDRSQAKRVQIWQRNAVAPDQNCPANKAEANGTEGDQQRARQYRVILFLGPQGMPLLRFDAPDQPAEDRDRQTKLDCGEDDFCGKGLHLGRIVPASRLSN